MVRVDVFCSESALTGQTLRVATAIAAPDRIVMRLD